MQFYLTVYNIFLTIYHKNYAGIFAGWLVHEKGIDEKNEKGSVPFSHFSCS